VDTERKPVKLRLRVTLLVVRRKIGNVEHVLYKSLSSHAICLPASKRKSKNESWCWYKV